jgi:hypothetical protein
MLGGACASGATMGCGHATVLAAWIEEMDALSQSLEGYKRQIGPAWSPGGAWRLAVVSRTPSHGCV